eukprot:4898525-Karenia_brevis.AAC.1
MGPRIIGTTVWGEVGVVTARTQNVIKTTEAGHGQVQEAWVEPVLSALSETVAKSARPWASNL